MFSFSFQKAEECFSVPNSNGCHHKSFGCTVVENGLQNKTSSVWGPAAQTFMRFGALENRRVGARAHIGEKGKCSALKSNLAAWFSRMIHIDQESHGDVSDPPVVYLNVERHSLLRLPPVTVSTASLGSLSYVLLFIHSLLKSARIDSICRLLNIERHHITSQMTYINNGKVWITLVQQKVTVSCLYIRKMASWRMFYWHRCIKLCKYSVKHIFMLLRLQCFSSQQFSYTDTCSRVQA